MGWNRLRSLGLLTTLAALGCTPARPAPPGPSAPEDRAIATFIGEADLQRGTLSVTEVRPTARLALVAIPDARPGTRRPGTVELSTAPATVREVPGGCGTVNDFEGEITLRSYFAGATLQNVHAELLTMTPSGYEGCNSDPAPQGLSAVNGLWSYGTVAAAGAAGDAVTRLWKFKLPSNTTNFTFTGRVVADGLPTPCAGLTGLPGLPATLLPAVSLSVPQRLAIADLNADGRLDVAVAYTGTSSTSVAVMLGAGNGTFLAPTTYTVGTNPQGIAVGDVNQDGKLDVVTANQSSSTVSVLLGNGDGTLQPATNRSTGASSSPGSVAVADLGGDGYPEVVVGLNAGGLAILPNAAGVLGTPVAYAGNSSPWVLLVADLNGDGRPDIAQTSTTMKLSVRLNDGSGAFPAKVEYGVPGLGPNVTDLRAADVTGDGRPDLVLANAYQVAAADPTLVAVFPSAGAGTFGAPVTTSVAGTVRALAALDLTGDGRTDLAVSVDSLGTVSLLANDGAGGLLPESSFPAVPGPYAMAAGDFTGDGRPDLLVVSDTQRLAAVLRNAGGGTFPARSAATTGATVDSTPVAVAVADLDGDWRPDALVIYNDAPAATYRLAVRLGNGDGTFGAPTEYPLASPVASLAVADLDRDGWVDVAVLNGPTVSVFAGGPGGVLAGPTTYAVDGSGLAGEVAIADLDGNGFPDLVVANGGRAQIYAFLNLGDGTFPATPVTYASSGVVPNRLVAADFSHDGWPDVVASGGGTLIRFRNAGNGTLVNVGAVFLARTPVDLAAADLDGDGWPDLAVADFGAQRGLGVLLNARTAGAVAFAAGVAYPIPSGALKAVAAGDVDGDGDVDLVVATTAGTAGLYANAGNGTLQAMTHYPFTLPGAVDVALADLTRDFRLDAVFVESRPLATPGRIVSAVGTCLP
jgi:hypothetical protein